MSKHRIKTISYDEDYDEDYDDEEEEELSEALADEDREQLRLGLIQVRQALGSNLPVTDEEIKETLWHYYYDVAKSTSYLKNKHKPDTTQKAKKPSRPAASSSVEDIVACSTPFSAKDFFRDSPWFNIPSYRRVDILIEPLYPRGGLLGGATPAKREPKMSKLAALAAKRRQKENEMPVIGRSQFLPSKAAASPVLGNNSRPGIVPPNRKPLDLDQTPPTISRGSPIPKPASTDAAAIQESPPTVADLRAQPSAFADMITEHKTWTSPEATLTADLANISFEEPPAEPYAFTDPSPDAIVSKARSSTQKDPTATKPPHKSVPIPKSKEDVTTNDLKKLTIDDQPRIKTKNLDVAAEYKKTKRKPAANFVVIGHVDAGKSTLMGHLLLSLGAVDSRTISKYQREATSIGKSSFALAWALDTDATERTHGVTIDVATRQLSTDAADFTILDAPGHSDFIPNMVAGAAQADFAVLVLDARPGEFESGMKGQTREHALLVRSIGLARLVVVVNKMDAAQPPWAEARFTEIRQQMSAFLTTAGFQPANITFVPCSGLRGTNIISLPPESDNILSWNRNGPTLLAALESLATPSPPALHLPLRLPVSSVAPTPNSSNFSISGRIAAGTLQLGQPVLILPTGAPPALVRGITLDDAEPTEWAVAGMNVTVSLSELDEERRKDVRAGDIACSVSEPARCVGGFTVKCLAFEHLLPMAVHVLRGRMAVPGRISKLMSIETKAKGEAKAEGEPKVEMKGKGKGKVRIVHPGSVATVEVLIDDAVGPQPIEKGDRVVLRAGGSTVATGIVE